jgi:XTP/dITP diphosphohydrolase
MNRLLVFASANKNKIEEVSHKLGGLPIRGLADIGCHEEIPETADTIEGNAIMKARYVWEKYKVNCFADDTGLEVEALGGKPGVYSARFAGEQKDSKANRHKVLELMKGELNRRARFKTVICLIIDGEETLIEGIAEGHITREERGDMGFGYDSIFCPMDQSRSFAQMTIEEKNILSHRGKALTTLKKILGQV